MPEARLPRKLLFGHALDVVDETVVRLIQLLQYLGKRQVSFLFCHLRIEDGRFCVFLSRNNGHKECRGSILNSL